jgi:hypothetical protein
MSELPMRDPNLEPQPRPRPEMASERRRSHPSFAPYDEGDRPGVHVLDYVRVLHKRRRPAIAAFLLIFGGSIDRYSHIETLGISCGSAGWSSRPRLAKTRVMRPRACVSIRFRMAARSRRAAHKMAIARDNFVRQEQGCGLVSIVRL